MKETKKVNYIFNILFIYGTVLVKMEFLLEIMI